MNPIMRKSGRTPEQLMRTRLYSLLQPRPLNAGAVNILGNDLPTDETSELYRVVGRAGKTVRDITRLHTWEEYQEMAEAALYITTLPAAKAGGDDLSARLGGKHLYLPACWGADEIEAQLHTLEAAVGLPEGDYTPQKAQSMDALRAAAAEIGDMPVSIDYTAHPRPLGLARLLTEAGFAVREVYLDSISAEEKADFDWLQAHTPELALYPTVSPGMRVRPRDAADTLAVGQKAAYFTGTEHFVNLVLGSGLYGFDGIVRLADLLREAYRTPKDTRSIIQVKGWGCGGCCI